MMSKKERLSQFNRNNIVTAAKELFAEKGVEQTTVDHIAKKADCSKSTIYVYFKSKEEIFDCIVLEHYVMLRDGLENATKDAENFSDGFYAICNTVADFYAKHPMYFDSVLGEIKIVTDQSDPVLFQVYQVGEEINAIMAEFFVRWMNEGQIRNDLPALPQTIFALWGSVCGIISLAHKKRLYINYRMETTSEEFMKSGFDLLLKSVLPGVGGAENN
ncbi:MAG: TetR/AcrR family transcriptional regulator [Defluviitaleaceae bacterium]|nr:TetR/AcrR family transcriptional regulator [Defluviitaleaceae bacterium]